MVEATSQPPDAAPEPEQTAESDLAELSGLLGLAGSEGQLWLRLARRLARGGAQAREGKRTSEFKLTALAVVVGGALMAVGAFGAPELAERLVDAGSQIALYPLLAYVGGRGGLKMAQEWAAGRVS